MDSMAKIVEEMRFSIRNDFLEKRELTEWADRIDALIKEPVAWVEVINAGRGPYCFHGYYFSGIELLPAGKHNLFAAPPAPAVAESLTKEPVAEIISHNTAANVWWYTIPDEIPIGTKLFASPPTSTQDLDDFLSRVQARIIELGYMPPAWPTNERDGTDDPVESAVRMICGLLDIAAPAVPDDTRRLDWLEKMVVEVRDPLLYGSLHMFYAKPVEVDGDENEPSDIRAKIDSALLAAAPEPKDRT